MKLCYLNDEQKPISVRIMDNRYDPFTGKGDFYVRLESCEGRMFELVIPEGHVPYVKKWKDLVMISHIDPAVLAQSEQDQPHQDGA